METIASVKHHTLAAVTVAGALLLSLGFAREASAHHLEACGGVWVEIVTACEVVRAESCMERCTPVSVEEVCASRLTTTCGQSCTAEADLSCRSGCETTCGTACTAEEIVEPPNCMGLCMSDCQQDCTVACAIDPESSHCRSSCAHICGDACHEKCDPAPVAECDTMCDSACWGSCEASANTECQISCQTERFTTCETEVVEECRSECQATGAAIFCDGQFLAADDLQACADELLEELDIRVDVSFGVDAEVDGDFGCSVGACSIAGGGLRTAGPAAMMLAFAGACAWRIGRARRRSS